MNDMQPGAIVWLRLLEPVTFPDCYSVVASNFIGQRVLSKYCSLVNGGKTTLPVPTGAFEIICSSPRADCRFFIRMLQNTVNFFDMLFSSNPAVRQCLFNALSGVPVCLIASSRLVIIRDNEGTSFVVNHRSRMEMDEMLQHIDFSQYKVISHKMYPTLVNLHPRKVFFDDEKSSAIYGGAYRRSDIEHLQFDDSVAPLKVVDLSGCRFQCPRGRAPRSCWPIGQSKSMVKYLDTTDKSTPLRVGAFLTSTDFASKFVLKVVDCRTAVVLYGTYNGEDTLKTSI